jgi:alpha-amylase/alpha-mannosidase (GH57 family)
MQRFICIHGHYYQPPRENPWTGRVEEEKSAHPFHDWNERITSECYAPNADSPVTNEKGKVVERISNYSWTSFDFGPTLLRWLEDEQPKVHKAIVDADRESESRFGGHGSAMAQVYNHMIMPLATATDKRTQTKWGVEDFERRFGRKPEGMWLPETAVDLASLEALAEEGIRFTILAPHQALAVRKGKDGAWTDVSGGRINTRKGYYCRLPSGKSIGIFFFNKGVSTELAFGSLLDSGESFSKALLSSFSNSDGPQLVNIATDGESYGHHRKKGFQSLSSCIQAINSSGSASLVNYGLYLAVAPPTEEVRIAEKTSWSCAHGVERWRKGCGCGSEIRAGYNQSWRGPLRTSMDWLDDRLSDIYSTEASSTFVEPKGAIWNYPSINVTKAAEVQEYVKGHLKSAQPVEKGVELLQMAECSALMLASCAWFWEDISRMETVEVLRFAARGIELAKRLTGVDLEPSFTDMLSKALSNDHRFGSGADLYGRLARR